MTSEQGGAITAARDPAVPSGDVQRWQGLAVLFLAQMVAIGSISYGFSVLLKPLAEDFDLSRASVNRGLMAVIVGMAVFGPVIGRALDRVSGRLVVMLGAVLFAAGWIAIAASSNVTVALLAAFFLLAPGGTALGPVAASTLVSRWFEKRRGFALGVAAVAMSTGGLVVVPVMALLIEAWGWRSAMTAFGLAASVLILVLAWMVLPPGRPQSTPSSDLRPTGGRPPAPWLQRDFWLVALAIGTVMGANGALLSCLVAFATDQGISLAQGTALVSVMSAGMIAGKLVLGALSDRIDPRWLFVAVAAVNMGLFGTLMTTPSYPVLFATVLLAGPAAGGVVPLWTVIVGRRFGLAGMGRAMGQMSAAMLPLNLAGLHLVGSMFDATGSYAPAFRLFLLFLAVAAIAILPVRRTGSNMSAD